MVKQSALKQYQKSSPKRIRRFAKTMKRQPTKYESQFYRQLVEVLSGSGLAVETQFIVKPEKTHYIIDFYLPDVSLGFEIDGEIHLNQQGYDIARDTAITSESIMMTRFKNDEISDPGFLKKLSVLIKQALSRKINYISETNANNVRKVVEKILVIAYQRKTPHLLRVKAIIKTILGCNKALIKREHLRQLLKISLHKLNGEKTFSG